MTTSRPTRTRRHLAQACVLAAGFWFSSAAWSIDTPPLQDPSSSKTQIALTKLHDITNRASELAVQALSMLGINYRYGGNSPETGLDCSGLVRYVFKEAWGTDLPRTSAEISRVGEKVERSICSPAIWCSTTRCVAVSRMSAFISATRNSSTRHQPAARCASKTWMWLTGKSASMARVASSTTAKNNLSR